MTGAGQQPELAWVCGRRGSNPVSHFIDGTPDWSRIAPLFSTFPDIRVLDAGGPYGGGVEHREKE